MAGDEKPERMYLVNIDTSEVLEAQFNPEQLETSLDVDYAELAPIGLPHKIAQYVGTGNLSFPLEFYFLGFGEADRKRIVDHRNFLDSLAYPKYQADSIASGAPSTVLFVWPNTLSIICRLKNVKHKHTHFAKDGGATRFYTSAQFFEVRDSRLTAEDVRAFGMLRAGPTT